MAVILPNGTVEFSTGKILMDDDVLTGAESLELVMLVPKLFPAVGMAGFPMRGGGGGGFGGGGGAGGGGGQTVPGPIGVVTSPTPGPGQGIPGPAGPPGADGPAGPVGPQGPAGTDGSLLGPAYVFTSPGDLTTTDNVLIPWVPGRGALISRARGVVKTAPTGADITVDIKRYTMATGVVVDTVGTLTIAAGTLTGTVVFVVPVTVLETQALAAEITQIGSGAPGANLTVMVD